TFRLRNAGHAELRLDHVKTSCGCLAGLASASEIPPGGEGRVNVVLDTTRITGHTTKVITVYTNDPGAPSAGLALNGSVTTDIVAAPSPLYLGKLRRGEAVEREIRVTAGRPGATYEVTAVEHSNPALHTSLERLPDGSGQRVVVTLEPHIPPGKVEGTVEIFTDHPDEGRLVVPLYAIVRDGGRRG